MRKRKRSVRKGKGKGEGGEIAAEGEQVTAEERGEGVV